jgi:hypothetical protein
LYSGVDTSRDLDDIALGGGVHRILDDGIVTVRGTNGADSQDFDETG